METTDSEQKVNREENTAVDRVQDTPCNICPGVIMSRDPNLGYTYGTWLFRGLMYWFKFAMM
jgi:hypothetical protein